MQDAGLPGARGQPTRRAVVLLALALAGVILAGCLGGTPPQDRDDDRFAGPDRPPFAGGHAVVAVIDTGVNPYHKDFRAPERTSRAVDGIPGYPADSRVLPLTLDATDYAAAIAADDRWWDLVEERTLYDVPGTRIVGVIAFGEPAAGPGAITSAPGLDEAGHGTASAGMAAAECPACWIVAVEVAGATEGRAALDWVATQPWIDAVVYPARAGVGFVGAGTHAADADTEFAWARTNAEAGQLVVVAAGNGWQDLSGTGAAAYTPARDVSYSYWTAGPDWVVTVGAAEPQSGAASAWHTLPVDIVAQGLDCDAPHPFSLDDRVVFEGTSCSAPVVAGQLGHVLATLRDTLGDGATGIRSGQRLVVPEDARFPTATREDLTRAYLLTAGRVAAQGTPVGIPDPTDPQTWTISDSPLSPIHAGWGLHDDDTLNATVQVLTGALDAPAPDDDEATWFAVDQRVRLAAWGAWDRGASRIDFPAPLASPVVQPASAAEVEALYQAAALRG